MNSSLQVVRDRRTGAVLFLKKRYPPFKNDPPLEFPVTNCPIEFPKLLSVTDEVAEEKKKKKKNLQPTDNNFLSSEFTDDYYERALLDIKNDYGIKQPAEQILEDENETRNTMNKIDGYDDVDNGHEVDGIKDNIEDGSNNSSKEELCSQRKKILRYKMNKGYSFVAAMLVMVLVCDQLGASEAAACSASQLSPCLAALQSGSAPSQDCCSRLKSQQSCLCGFMKDPSLKQYVNSPNARKVAGQCGVTLPNC
ncbi:hypothetical protein HAX54_043773 [Datura stramonium]|uniref:Bifunctional inhibitor/plant lipid transfer protein/seed storage helical domain-containing protein n=1 Tax=Datura stramonium TaxID=4076 RepID=A0ABS8SNY8_DATST|nr:hypothetical protein [Datura stramonium]